MVRAAVPICGTYITTRSGITVSNIHAWSKEYHAAAVALGFTDTLAVVGVAAGSPAERAGLVVGDRLLGVAGTKAPVGRTAVVDFSNLVTPKPATRGAPAFASGPLELSVSRASAGATLLTEVAISARPDTACAYGSSALKDDQLNVWAASQGINTGGDFTNQGANIGAMSYSQDFEREADYVGMYILARTGRNIDNAANFWRRLAQESPGSIKYASSHPTTAERFLRLEQAVVEIKAKQQAGEAILPTPKAPARPTP